MMSSWLAGDWSAHYEKFSHHVVLYFVQAKPSFVFYVSIVLAQAQIDCAFVIDFLDRFL